MIYFIGMFLVAQMGLGYWISKKIKSTRDFFLAGRSLPLPIIAMSLVATWFGAETCIGSSGAVYVHGLSGSRADPFGYSLCLLLMGLLIAAPLWRGGHITLSDFFAKRYGSSTEKLSAIILIPSSLIWAAAQVRAFGQIVSSTTDLPAELTIIFATAFIVIYTLLGGMLGDIISDIFKIIVITIGLTCLTVAVFTHPDFQMSWFTEMNPARYNLMSPLENIFQRLDRWAVPVLGSLVAQELISRTLSAKSPRVAQNSSYLACALYLFLGAMPVFLGLMGPYMLPGVLDQEQFITLLAAKYLHPTMLVVFIGALISAILSTIDTILLSIAALASQNLIQTFIEVKTEKAKLYTARVLVVVTAIAAYLIARSSAGIYPLVEMASSFGTAGLLVVTLIGLWTKWGGAKAATVCLIVGLIFYPLADQFLKLDAPFLSTVLVSFIGFLIGTFMDRRHHKKRGAGNQPAPQTR
jgi:Na+/proline symporter